jgi:hypothetical protein
MVASTDRRAIGPIDGPDEHPRRLSSFPPISSTKPERPQRRNQPDFDKNPDWCLLGRQPPAHYHAVAARARRLQTEATTPRLKQYLEEMIAQSEQLAGEVQEYFGNGAGLMRRSARPKFG